MQNGNITIEKLATEFKVGDTFKKFGNRHVITEIEEYGKTKLYFSFIAQDGKPWAFAFKKTTKVLI